MHIETKLEALGFILPEPLTISSGPQLSFRPIRIWGNRACISGHIPLNADGSIAEPRGKVGKDLSLEMAYQAAQLTALSMLGSLKRELGDLDRVVAWLKVYGMVNSTSGFVQQPVVLNGFSDLIVTLYGGEVGHHARSAVGVAELPFGVPVEIEAEVEINSQAALC